MSGCTEAKSRSIATERKAMKQEKDRERQRASTREGRETALNNAVDYGESRARQRRSNNTEQCGEAKLTRAVETWRNTRQIDLEDYRTSKVEIRASR